MATRRQIEEAYAKFDLNMKQTRASLRKLLDTARVDLKQDDTNPFYPLNQTLDRAETLVEKPIAEAVMLEIRDRNWKKLRQRKRR